MNSPVLDAILAQYAWQSSLVAAIGIVAVMLIGRYVLMLVPTLRSASTLNRDTFQEKMKRPSYAANQSWNRKWAPLYLLVIFVAVLPFCLTMDAQPWWRVVRDIVIILMFYDFFYYLTHRFLFHDGGFLGGPLMWVHAVHHRQHNPCRADSSFIHPLEVAIGLGLYTASIAILSLILGQFHVVTLVITWIAFSEINLHNHDRWEADHFPFKYLNHMSVMHHNHHARFTGGNYATITLLYDWLFGTLDKGEGYGKKTYKKKARV